MPGLPSDLLIKRLIAEWPQHMLTQQSRESLTYKARGEYPAWMAQIKADDSPDGWVARNAGPLVMLLEQQRDDLRVDEPCAAQQACADADDGEVGQRAYAINDYAG